MTIPPLNHLAPIAATAALLAAGLAPVDGPRSLAARLRDDGWNRADLERMEAGYYERLLATGPARSRLSPAAPPFKDGPLAVLVDDYRECVLKPDLVTRTRHGTWTTNDLGMRDRPYAIAKPAGVFRIVLLGDSIGVGWGVDDDEGFEPRLEAALGAGSRGAGGPRVEVLNLCVPGYAPGQRVEHLRRLGASLAPDLILYEATEADLAWDERRLRALLPLGRGGGPPMFADVLARAGWSPGLDANEARESLGRLRSLRPQLVGSAYRELAALAGELGCPVAWALVPRVGRENDPTEHRLLLDQAREAGFAAMLDLSDTFDGLDARELAVAPDDYHPNAAGHALLADRLERGLAAGWPWTPGGTGRPRPVLFDPAADGGPAR